MFKSGRIHFTELREERPPFLLSPPLLRNKGGNFSTLLVHSFLRLFRPSDLFRGLLSVTGRHPFSSSSGTSSIQQPLASICPDGRNYRETPKEVDVEAVSAICTSVISRCFHLWEKKGEPIPDVSSVLDFVKLSIGSSPQAVRCFWRVSALRPEDVLAILKGFGPEVGKKYVGLLLKLFLWSGKQARDFHHLPETYESMVSMLIRSQMFREAESVLVESPACEAFFSKFSGFFSEIIQGYVATCDLKASIALYDRARRFPGVILSVSCCQALLRRLVEHEKAEFARRIYMDMCDMNIVSITENSALEFLVCMWCKNGQSLDVMNLLKRVRHLGIKPGRASLDAVVDMYCKKRDFGDLLHFLKEWQHLPSIHLCNKIISCLCGSWGTDQAWLFMQKMKVVGFAADPTTFLILIRWSCREGSLRNAFSYLSEMSSRMLTPDVQVYNTLLSGLFKEKMWNYAREVYFDMVEKGPVPDMLTFRVMLAGFCRERKFDEVTHVLGEMVNRGFACLSPSEDIFSKAFSLVGLDCLHVKVKRDNNILFPKAEFFDLLGNGLYLDTDLSMYETILTKILDDVVFPEFDFVVQKECRKGDMETALLLTNDAVQHGHTLSILTYSLLVKGLIASDSFTKEVVNVLEENPELFNHLDHQTLNLLLKAFSENRAPAKENLIIDVLFRKELSLTADICSSIIMSFCRRGDVNGFMVFWNRLQRSHSMPEWKDAKFLLNSLLKWELFKEAFELFEIMSMKYPGLIPVICGTFIKEFCAAGFTIVSYIFVCETLQRHFNLENSSWEYLMTRLCEEKRIPESFHILDVMLEKNVVPSSSLCYSLLHMLFRFSRVEKDKPFVQVKWREESKVLFPFHGPMLKELYRFASNLKAGTKLQKLKLEELLPSHCILDMMLQLYCQEKNFRKVHEVLCIVMKMHLHISMTTYVDLVRLSCSIGRVHDGLGLADLMLKKHEFSPLIICNIMLFSLLQGGHFSLVDYVLNYLKQHSFSPDQNTFNFLIHGYYKCGNAEKSVDLLKTMIARNLQPNNRSLRTGICYLCSHARLREALSLSQTMENKGWEYGTVIQTVLIQSLLSHGRHQEAEQLLGRLQDKNLVGNKVYYDILIKSFCLIKRVDTAVKLLNLMLKNGNLPSEKSYNFVLQGFLVHDALNEALDICAEMLHNELQPCMGSRDMVIQRLCGDGRTSEAEALLDLMMTHGVAPSENMFHAIFYKYCSEKNLLKTNEFLRKMRQHGILPDFWTHWSLIRNLNSVNTDKGKDNRGNGFLTHLLSKT